MIRVFVSSTSVDLHEHRNAVRDAIMGLGMHPVMMEYFPAMDANAVEACRKSVLSCDLLVGIYAHRYGYIPQGQSKSITEMEYDWATEQKLPRTVFVVNPDYQWSAEFTDKDETPLNNFKKRVGTERVWNTFTTPESLGAKVTQSLTQSAEQLARREGQQRNILFSGLAAIALLLLLAIGAVI